MDNSFEQQFTQNLKATPIQPVEAPSSDSSKLPLVISIVLAAIVLFESIALVVALTNYFDTFSYSESEEIVLDDDPTSSNYSFDEDDNLVAFAATCTNSDTGASFTLSKNNSYRENSSATNLTGSGSYAIKRDSIITFTDSTGEKKTLFYDGYILTDGITIYDCEETDLSNTANTNAE